MIALYGLSKLECVCRGCETDSVAVSRPRQTREVSYAIQCIRRRVLKYLVVVTPTPAPFGFLSEGYHLEAG